MEQPRQTEFTADEFIAWALEQPTGRYELDNGTVVAMAPERVNHSRAKLNVTIALRDAVGARGLTCEAIPDGASVRVNDRTVYGPDAVVRCGPPLPGDAVEMGTRAPALASRTRHPQAKRAAARPRGTA
jgi:Uma2 family endonuclease